MRKRNMSVDYISFSAHADCEQTTDFVRQVEPKYVVLVHGDSNEMNRLKSSLENKYKGQFPVFAPQNSQSVTISFDIKRNTKIVMENEEMKASEGIIVRKYPDHIIVPTDAISNYTSISCNKIAQKLQVPYVYSLRVMQFLIKNIFPNTCTVQDNDVKCLLVE
jgi:cleavage and polyadenylation specificity factor subunit 3